MHRYREAAHRAAAERLVQFAQSGKARPILRKHSQFLQTEHGRRVWYQLAQLSDKLLCGDLTPGEYDLRVVLLAIWAEVPTVEFRIVARLSAEFHRCIFFGTGDVPIADINFDDGARDHE
jgi:hypothetical protein